MSARFAWRAALVVAAFIAVRHEAVADPADRSTFRERVRSQASAVGMPPQVADAVAEVESGYDPEAVGKAGEIGLMQVMPSTARLLGFKGTLKELADPETNIRYGVTYLSQAWRLSGGDLCATVMKYRAGHGESRYSQRSVDYCARVRAKLISEGYPVTSSLPAVNLVTSGPDLRERWAIGAPHRRSRINWAAADARMKQLTAKVTPSMLKITN